MCVLLLTCFGSSSSSSSPFERWRYLRCLCGREKLPRTQASSEVSLQEAEYPWDLLLLAVIRSDHSGKLPTVHYPGKS